MVKHFISLGAGVQSSTMALMAAHGEITPMPDAAIFADTQAEPSYVYEQVDWIRSAVPFPVYVTTKSSLTDDLLTDGFSQIPCFHQTGDKKATKGKKQCTTHWKIKPTYREMRRRTDTVGQILPVGFFVQWLGISTDEASRMKDSQIRSVQNRWPLIELGMSRKNCIEWLTRQNYPIPKRSACVFCPLQSKAEWKEKRESKDWMLIRRVEDRLRVRNEFLDPYGYGLDNYIDGVIPHQPNFFINECEGMCGV